jgi:hypothetical protein
VPPHWVVGSHQFGRGRSAEIDGAGARWSHSDADLRVGWVGAHQGWGLAVATYRRAWFSIPCKNDELGLVEWGRAPNLDIYKACHGAGVYKGIESLPNPTYFPCRTWPN